MKIKKIILICNLILIVIMSACSSKQVVENYNYNISFGMRHTPSNAYVNEESYTDGVNFREVEYIGGTNITLDRNYPLSDDELLYVGDRWYPFFRDKNTGEILRGLEIYDFITVGAPFIGIDKVNVPKERMTRRGFQNYVLKWTACVHTMPHEKYELVGSKIAFRHYYNGQYMYSEKEYNGFFDLPIDVIADNMWGNHYDNDDKDVISKEKIYSVDDVKNKKYEIREYRLSSNGWILNILRNCFGYISDSFYDIYCRDIIRFDRISLNDVNIGDIGIIQENEDDYYMGICIGFDKILNPIFSVGLSKKMTKDIVNECLKNIEITFGSNMLHIEDINNDENNIFNYYYKTNLPFIDNDENKINYIVTDVNKYNKQIEYYLNKEDYIKNNVDLNKVLLDERIERISNRENDAEKKRLKYKIDLSKYKNIDISTIYMINQNKTYEYEKYYYTLKNLPFVKKPEDFVKKTDKERISEIIKERTRESNIWFNNLSIKEKEELYKNCDVKGMIEEYKDAVDWNDIDAVNKWLVEMEAPDVTKYSLNKYLTEGK